MCLMSLGMILLKIFDCVGLCLSVWKRWCSWAGVHMARLSWKLKIGLREQSQGSFAEFLMGSKGKLYCLVCKNDHALYMIDLLGLEERGFVLSFPFLISDRFFVRLGRQRDNALAANATASGEEERRRSG